MPKVLIECETVETLYSKEWVEVADEWLEEFGPYQDPNECVEEGLGTVLADFRRSWKILQVEGDEWEQDDFGDWYRAEEFERVR